ncbi:MAG TPA: HRDC domain-containing protein [Pirellulales bacterium]|nr:HRDC domain-containing protein [Pirellulales bacterium]
MSQQIIISPRELSALCRRLATSGSIAFDTEFVSEHTYRPQLCLVQVACDGEMFAIDPLAIGDLTEFWQVLAAPGHETIVHAGREEINFCLAAVGRPPANLFDVQIASGLIGLEYPAGYGNLIYKLLGATPRKGETRTDWRRRPLSDKQIDYALEDVRHLHPLRDKLHGRLAELERLSWLAAEMAAFEEEVIHARSRERWRKVTGSSSLSSRSQAIVREVWLWRESEAERRNCPVRRVLRDDLIVELAKRRSADPKQIRAVRGMERGDLQRHVPAIAKAIEKSLETPDEKCPETVRRDASPQLAMLGQFLSSALSSICRAAEVAPSLVGTPNDVRDLIAYQLGEYDGAEGEKPALAEGWRAEVVGQLLDDLLDGKVSIRIRDPRSEQPLAFERE